MDYGWIDWVYWNNGYDDNICVNFIINKFWDVKGGEGDERYENIYF